MARIEIGLDEYNGLRKRIKELEEQIASNNKTNENLLNELEDTKDIIDDIINTSWFNRCFKWKTIKNNTFKK